MATIHHPEVTGWASTSNLSGLIGPSVVVSPDAAPTALICWAHGQIEQLATLLRVISQAAQDMEPDQALLAGSVLHQLEQVLTVTGEAISRLQVKGAA